MALMSDYQPSALLVRLPEIREQLGILEASLVPDTDDGYIPDTSHENDDDLIHSTSSLSLDVPKKKKGGKRRKSPLSGTASTSHSGQKSGRGAEARSETASTSDSGPNNGHSSKTRSTGTTPLSETEEEDEDVEGYLNELELLGELFPTV